MIKASVYIICKNEEKHIQRVLESVKDFDEIIVVDSGSIDNTLEIARKPFINFVWLGTIFVVIGFFFAMYSNIKERRNN